MPKRPRVGDILRIPLGCGTFAYAHYVEFGERNGAIIRVYNRTAPTDPTDEELRDSDLMFPPVIAGIFAATRTGRWSVVRNRPVSEYKHPLFINDYTDKEGRVTDWWLINGSTESRLGPILPTEYRQLEPEAVWPAEWIEERIRDRTHPFIEAYRAKF